MTPKEKAKELFNKYESTIILNSWCDENTTEDEINSLIKKCALTAVYEILSNDNLHTELFIYYSQVKIQIEKL
jgi:hypothetical protein